MKSSLKSSQQVYEPRGKLLSQARAEPESMSCMYYMAVEIEPLWQVTALR